MRKSMKNNTNRNKAVCQMDSKGNVLNEFASLKIAGETLNISPSGITKAIKGEQKTAGKYYWKLK